MLTYAIGDIHGCADELQQILDRIEAHRAGRSRRMIFLGDYIDAGPDSARVLEMLRSLYANEPDRVVCLMGNHEQIMLEACDGVAGEVAWLPHNGGRTLESFGVTEATDLPESIVAWVRDLPTVHEDALRYYVHAGFRPGRPGIDPDVHTRLWIREPFLSSNFDFGKHVVHGHTPTSGPDPDVRPNRTNLDTGCVYGRPLSAGVFTDGQAQAVEFIQVG